MFQWYLVKLFDIFYCPCPLKEALGVYGVYPKTVVCISKRDRIRIKKIPTGKSDSIREINLFLDT
jgi:hypothetical protein